MSDVEKIDSEVKEDASGSNDEGVNYRDIAQLMTESGYKMNHSSVRNYVIRIMKKFVSAYVSRNDINLTDERIDEIAKSSSFQKVMANILHMHSIKDKNVKR